VAGTFACTHQPMWVVRKIGGHIWKTVDIPPDFMRTQVSEP
jgi:hypothetical protein